MSDPEHNTRRHDPAIKGRPVIFGEVLFDSFPGGEDVLGGAPFNVAWHLHGLGLNPLFISRIGDDARGERVLDTMRQWGMDCSGMQRDSEQATGSVRVVMEEDGHHFEILPRQAYDFIDGQAAGDALRGIQAGLLYMGSLICRGEASRHALRELMATGLPCFVDINLRPPWWNLQEVMALLDAARWAKLNDEELAELSPCNPQDEDLQTCADTVRRDHDIEWLVLTRGARGASLHTQQGVVQASAPNVAELVDTVGAGDAFSAVTLAGLMQGWTPERLLPRALNFAAAICRQRGATAADKALYADTLREWSA